jgi:hypothetical protein
LPRDQPAASGGKRGNAFMINVTTIMIDSDHRRNDH